MKRLIFILLASACGLINAQKRYAYRYGINNADGRYVTRGLLNSNENRIRWSLYAYSGDLTDPETGLRTQSCSPETLDMICDFRDKIVYGNDTILLKDIHCGKYFIGMSAFYESEKAWVGRAFAEQFTNRSRYININRKDDE